MKHLKGISKVFLGLFFSIAGGPVLFAQTSAENEEVLLAEINDSVMAQDPAVLFAELKPDKISGKVVNRSFVPKVFSGYRKLHVADPEFLHLKKYSGYMVMTSANDSLTYISEEIVDTNEPLDITAITEVETGIGKNLLNDEMPSWLRKSLLKNRQQEDLAYLYMIDNPQSIEYAYWDLPEPPVLWEDDVTFIGYIKRMKLPEVDMGEAVLPENEVGKHYWLHQFQTLLQFSQAFVSPNWYQGGNNYLALLFNFNWNVQLNQVYHPNLLFQSNLQYKLALSSTPKGNLHRYTISEDAFQYNLNAGVKAVGNWFYSFNLLFKTQLLNNFEENSYVRTASFLSPGDLNMGLGMAYSRKNKVNTFQYTLTLSPLSYNLKTCITDKIDHSLYNIAQDKKVKNEIGSNIEFNMDWKITSNINYKTRLFLFTNYQYFLSDWENTFSFEINKFLSTQVYVHLRYDTSADKNTSWKTFMMREILSFGLSYTFSTKP